MTRIHTSLDELDSLIENYLNGVTLADLVRDESLEEPSGPCIS